MEEHDIEYPIDYREDNDASYPLKKYALSVVQDLLTLGREVETAKLAQDESNYTEGNKIVLSGTSQFSNPKSNPLDIIDTGINAIYSTIGRKPNVCVISADVWAVLKKNETLLERIKYTHTGTLTPTVFAELIEVERSKPKEKEYNLVDGQGLSLRIKTTGTKTWIFNYYHPSIKKRTNFTIGNYRK